MMRSLRRDRLDCRFSDWSERLRSENLERKKASELYCGNYWSVIREIAANEKLPSRLRIWVISAGHGLVSIDESLAPYAATFSSGDDDSVIPPELSSHSVAEWWGKLVCRRRQDGGSVASISDIARLHPKEPLIAAISNQYFKAVANDLEEARSALANADGLIIIAAGAVKSGALAKNLLPCDSRLEHRYGRSRIALNARILREIVHRFSGNGISASRLSLRFKAMLSRLPKAGYPERLPSEDKEVRSFIRREIAKSEKSAYTVLLRQYRATGQACEQKRFRGIFREVVANKNEAKD